MCIPSTHSQDNGGYIEGVAAIRRLRQGRGIRSDSNPCTTPRSTSRRPSLTFAA